MVKTAAYAAHTHAAGHIMWQKKEVVRHIVPMIKVVGAVEGT